MPTANYDKDLAAALSTIAIKCNFYQHQNSSAKKALIVEGVTDKIFLDRITNSNVLSFSIGDLINTRAKMLHSNNRKGLILYLFQRLSNSPEFFGFPIGCGKWHIYGLVDRDYDDELLNFRLPHLFITDTHDIETLMISTDGNVFKRIKGLCLLDDTIRSSLFLAGQLAYYRQALYKLAGKKQEIDIKNIKSSNGIVNFSVFVENDIIVPGKLIKLLYSNKRNRLSNEKLNALTRTLLNDRQLKKHLEQNGVWKHQKNSFSPDQDEDFWTLVRGHDILSAICFFDPVANTLIQNSAEYDINREFEKLLIDAYDISSFSKTKLYHEMHSVELTSV